MAAKAKGLMSEIVVSFNGGFFLPEPGETIVFTVLPPLHRPDNQAYMGSYDPDGI